MQDNGSCLSGLGRAESLPTLVGHKKIIDGRVRSWPINRMGMGKLTKFSSGVHIAIVSGQYLSPYCGVPHTLPDQNNRQEKLS